MPFEKDLMENKTAQSRLITESGEIGGRGSSEIQPSGSAADQPDCEKETDAGYAGFGTGLLSCMADKRDLF
jgi:hypothetical protein